MNAPKVLMAKVDTITTAWETLAAAESFGGLSVDEFKAAIQPSLAARAQVEDLARQLAAAINARAEADKASQRIIKRVVNGVVGNPHFGPDCSLYKAMGYVRESERKSGLTRKKSPPTDQP